MKKSGKRSVLFVILLVLLLASMAGVVSADVFINEFLANGSIEPDSEWVELFNDANSVVNLTGFNISESGSANFTLNTIIPAKGFIVLVQNFTLFNSTFPGVNESGIKIVEYGTNVISFQLSNTPGSIEVYNSSGDLVDSISYSSTIENVSTGRFPDGSGTITDFTALTPGNKNDKDAPVINKWINPSANNSIIRKLFNVTVNITDSVYSVNTALINFNNSNFSMTNAGDLWYYLWNTTKNPGGLYNITIFFDDTLGFSNTDTLFNITVNNTNGAPNITSTPITTATERVKYTYDVEATDPDLDVLTFSLITFPNGMSIIPTSGLISWIPSSNQLGLNNVIVNVSDSNLTTLQSFNITVGKGPRLIISDLDVKVDGKTDKNVGNNTRIGKDAAPGSIVVFKLEIENLFTDDEDLEIEDIDIEITIEDIDDGDDLEEDADEFDIKQGKNEDLKIKFEIPLEVDEGIFDVLIEVEGEDENGTTHEIRWALELEVEKESHEIRIIRAALAPSTISCQRRISLNTEIINTGSDDEDDVTLEITSPELGISSVVNDIELDEGTDDNRYTRLITESISPDVLPGTYPIEVSVFYDGTASETRTVSLEVEECELTKAVKKQVKEKKPEVEVIRPLAVIEKKPAPEPFSSTDEYKTLLAILVVLFLGTAIFVIGAGYIILKK